MNEENIATIIPSKDSHPQLGRTADKLAAGLGLIGATFSVIAAIWFFLGFAENDTRPEHLMSAFILTGLLFAFAIVPFICVAGLAQRAHRKGTKRTHLFWTLFLMLPWVALGGLAVAYTPLPVWCGLIIAGLAGLISIWALTSLILDWNA